MSEPSTDRPEVLDLRERHVDVRRIARKQVGWRLCREAGWDADDLDQEVFLRVLRRQDMGSKYDPKRGSVSKYLTEITRGILLNLWDIAKNRAREVPCGEFDDTGMMVPKHRRDIDVAR